MPTTFAELRIDSNDYLQLHQGDYSKWYAGTTLHEVQDRGFIAIK